MDEKTAMTVEFLRARLLSERNVSRTARQRADFFAQRVMELEEQLRIVNSQRKNAEKAAEDVLAILETRGITYVSELTDSSAEQEDSCRSLSEDGKENGYLTFSGLGKNEVDDALPRSDIDGHLSEHNSLTWKFRGSRLDSQEKQKAKQNKHRNRGNFVVEVKPFQHRLGKSCRKIKRLDAGSSLENELQKDVLDSHENGMVPMPKNFHGEPGHPMGNSESNLPQFPIDSSVSIGLDDQNEEDNNVKNGKDDGMERALEQQAQLIGQFQAMENAQREWEEKFNESKISMQDNQNGIPVDNSVHVSRIQQHEDEKSFVKDVRFTEDEKPGICGNCETLSKREISSDKFLSSDVMSTSLSRCMNGFNGCANESFNQQHGAAAVNEIGTVHELFTFSPLDGPELTSKGKVGPSSQKPNAGSLSNLKLHDVSEHAVQMIIPREKPKIWNELPKHLSQQLGLDDTRSTQSYRVPLQESPCLVATRKDLHGSVYQKTNASRHSNSKVNNPHGQLMLHNFSKHLPMVHEKVSDPEFTEVKELSGLSSKSTSRNLGSVLQSLQQARSSIKRELAKQPSLGQGTLVIAQPSNSPVKPISSMKALDLPTGPPGLFTLPTDSVPPAQYSGANFHGSGLRLTATRADLDLMNSLPSCISNEYFDRLHSASYMKTGYRSLTDRDCVDDPYTSNPNMDGISKFQLRNATIDVPHRYLDSGSRVATMKDYFDRNSSSSFSASSPHKYSHCCTDLSTNRFALQNELTKSSSDRRNRVPSNDRHSYGRDYSSLS